MGESDVPAGPLATENLREHHGWYEDVLHQAALEVCKVNAPRGQRFNDPDGSVNHLLERRKRLLWPVARGELPVKQGEGESSPLMKSRQADGIAWKMVVSRTVITSPFLRLGTYPN